MSPETTCYEGIEFNPRGTTPNYINLWVGPTIQPRAGDAEPIKRFLLVVICGGNPHVYRYLLRYLAHALQFPWKKPGVMITLLGGHGTGKGTFACILQQIWGAAFLRVHNIDEMTLTFNGALENAYIMFMDEALFVGNRSGTNALKSMSRRCVLSSLRCPFSKCTIVAPSRLANACTAAANSRVIGAISVVEATSAPRCPLKNATTPPPVCKRGW